MSRNGDAVFALTLGLNNLRYFEGRALKHCKYTFKLLKVRHVFAVYAVKGSKIKTASKWSPSTRWCLRNGVKVTW